jgi:hypothetical protein
MGRGEVQTGFWWGNLKERDHLEDSGVDGRIILRWIFRKLHGVMEWIILAQDRKMWRASVNAIMNLRVPSRAGNFLIAENRLASHEGLCFMGYEE